MRFSKYLLKLLPLMMLLTSQLAHVSAVTFSPLPNATVSVGGENGEGFVITESDGIFIITQGLGAGNYAVEISHPGYVSRMLNTIITAGVETDLGDIELRVSGSIRGVVTDPGGNPTSNITVQCKDESDNTPVGYTVTSADGSFTFDTDIKNGTYTVEALLFTGSGLTSPAGYASNKTTGIQGTEGQTTSGVIVQLGPSGTISGTVKDKSSVPIENVSILASGMQSTHGGYATTNPQGEYMINSNL
ncbi:carboxypeptidase-like regulatory domain-containing protein, partial [Candidatus Bathyarchaeota archaeon]|nr:carboxypeptidase-like regulatory domain-containing protein [Candidatus Bathyarchaeota archaeon]